MTDHADNLQQILDAAPLGILLQDESGRITWLNNALTALLGNDLCDQLVNMRSDELGEPLSTLFQTDDPVRLPGDALRPDIWMMPSRQELPDNRGTIYYLVNVTSLQQENRRLQQELDDISMVDNETGMRNRKGIYYSLEPQLSRSRRYDRPLSVIIMRLDCLDRFKEYIGRDDALPLLKAISYLLSDQLRWADIVGRLNETDFLLVLPEIHMDDANKVAGNLRDQVTALKIADLPDADFNVTAGFGVAEWQKGDDMGLLLMRARNQLEDSSNSKPAATG